MQRRVRKRAETAALGPVLPGLVFGGVRGRAGGGVDGNVQFTLAAGRVQGVFAVRRVGERGVFGRLGFPGAGRGVRGN